MTPQTELEVLIVGDEVRKENERDQLVYTFRHAEFKNLVLYAVQNGTK